MFEVFCNFLGFLDLKNTLVLYYVVLAVFTAESFPPTNLVTCSDGSPQCGV